jgi:hypothetical protein
MRKNKSSMHTRKKTTVRKEANLSRAYVEGYGYVNEISKEYTPEEIFRRFVRDEGSTFAIDGLGTWANYDFSGFKKWSPRLGRLLMAATKAAADALPKFQALYDELEQIED